MELKQKSSSLKRKRKKLLPLKKNSFNKNSNDELYNLTHNFVERKESNTICCIWLEKQQTRNCLQTRIGIEYVKSPKNKSQTNPKQIPNKSQTNPKQQRLTEKVY